MATLELRGSFSSTVNFFQVWALATSGIGQRVDPAVRNWRQLWQRPKECATSKLRKSVRDLLLGVAGDESSENGVGDAVGGKGNGGAKMGGQARRLGKGSGLQMVGGWRKLTCCARCASPTHPGGVKGQEGKGGVRRGKNLFC